MSCNFTWHDIITSCLLRLLLHIWGKYLDHPQGMPSAPAELPDSDSSGKAALLNGNYTWCAGEVFTLPVTISSDSHLVVESICPESRFYGCPWESHLLLWPKRDLSVDMHWMEHVDHAHPDCRVTLKSNCTQFIYSTDGYAWLRLYV